MAVSSILTISVEEFLNKIHCKTAERGGLVVESLTPEREVEG